MNKKEFCDLNIPVGTNCRSVCNKALELGYRILAINTVVLARECCSDSNKGSTRIGKKRKFRDVGPMTISPAAQQGNSNEVPAPSSPDWITPLLEKYPGVRILQRITVIFGNSTELQQVLTHRNCLLYDIVAIVPIHLDAVQACLTAKHLSFDIITFDLEGPYWMKKIKLSRQKGNMAADREIYFEITYSSGLHGETACENMMYAANCLLEDTCPKRIKNIVITSGALKPEEIRTPKDFNSFGFLLGLTETTSTQCIREHPQRIVGNADARKNGKTWVKFIPSSKSVLGLKT